MQLRSCACRQSGTGQDSATLGPASSPGCCFRAAGDDWCQCPALLSFKGQGIQRKSLSCWTHCVSPKERHISLSHQTLLRDCILPRSGSFVLHSLSWNCCTLPHSCSLNESWPWLRSLQCVSGCFEIPQGSGIGWGPSAQHTEPPSSSHKG